MPKPLRVNTNEFLGGASLDVVTDQGAATTLLKNIRVYPLSNSPPARADFIDTVGKDWNDIPRLDETFYTLLAKMTVCADIDLAQIGYWTSLIDQGCS